MAHAHKAETMHFVNEDDAVDDNAVDDATVHVACVAAIGLVLRVARGTSTTRDPHQSSSPPAAYKYKYTYIIQCYLSHLRWFIYYVGEYTKWICLEIMENAAR